MDKTEDILLCECSSDEHQIILRSFDNDNEIYCSIHLTTQSSFFKRLWIGLKYAFGYKSKFGHWDEFILSKKHIEKLNWIIKKIE